MNQKNNTAEQSLRSMPFVRLELVVMSVIDGALQVLLVQRDVMPFKGQWALPGGVLRIDLDASPEDGAQRVAQERLKITLPYLRQQATVGGRDRDPRAPWTLSVVFRALVPIDSFKGAPGKRIKDLAWVPVDQAVKDKAIAFDHSDLIAQSAKSTRAEVQDMVFPEGFVPETFTINGLQEMCEAILGARLSKVTFRRRLDQRGLVEPVEGVMVWGGAHRPSQVYRLKGATRSDPQA